MKNKLPLTLTLLEKDGNEYVVKCSNVSFDREYLKVYFSDSDTTVLVKVINIDKFNIV